MNLGKTLAKLDRLLGDFRFTTVSGALGQFGGWIETGNVRGCRGVVLEVVSAADTDLEDRALGVRHIARAQPAHRRLTAGAIDQSWQNDAVIPAHEIPQILRVWPCQ